MQLRTVIICVAGLAASASAAIPANPVVKHLPGRAINIDGSFAGLIFKRQASCPEGYSACGTGCSAGPCCNSDSGLACRDTEICTEINGNTGCCPEGYTCDSIRGCQNVVGTGCTPGSIDNGLLCCDATAPVCSTNSGGIPYCAGAVPDVVYTVSTGASDSTSTTSVTTTATLTVTTDSASDTVTASEPTESVSATETESVMTTETMSVTATETESLTSSEYPTSSESDILTIQTILPTMSETGLPELSTTYISTFTSTVGGIPYPTGNGNGTGNATTTIPVPEATGAANKLGMSGFALTIVMGLAFVL